MKRLLYLILIPFTIYSCATNAVTNRRQLKLVPEAEVQAMAQQQYRQFLSQNRVLSASVNRDAEMVRRVGQRLTTAITNYYKQQGKPEVLEGYEWEYNLVESPEANAWCMPGGKIVVYTGLLPITQNEAALAVVVGHEITHALAHHGSERMSQGLLQQLGGAALSVALASRSQETQNLFMQAYGIGSQVGVMLPFSRRDEYEADQFGLYFTAMAGYNPQEAVALWRRMEAQASGARPPEFLSTHPSEGSRIARLEKHMPQAMKYYRPVQR